MAPHLHAVLVRVHVIRRVVIVAVKLSLARGELVARVAHLRPALVPVLNVGRGQDEALVAFGLSAGANLVRTLGGDARPACSGAEAGLATALCCDALLVVARAESVAGGGGEDVTCAVKSKAGSRDGAVEDVGAGHVNGGAGDRG